MMNADELISILLDNEKIKNGKLFEGKIYRDEPILQTAAVLAKQQTPEKLKQMRQLAYTSEAVWKTEEWLFCKQGKFMEDFDDCFECSDIRSISRPSYKELSNDELRSFFTWRGKIRRGEDAAECDTFIYLYAFELINLIGADSPQNAYDKLLALYQRFPKGRTGSRLCELMNDICAYYQLPPEYCRSLPQNDFDSALLALINYDTADDDKLFSAVIRLSDHKIETSVCFKKHPEEYKEAVCHVIRSLSEHYKDSKPLHIQLFGLMLSRWYIPFRSAYFFNKEGHLRSFEYEVNEVRKYSCNKGIWQQKSYISARSKRLGAAMKTTDHLLRRHLGMKNALKKGELSKTDEEIVTNALNELFEEKKKAALPKIEIDLSKLGEIRRSADITRDKLVIEEEADDHDIAVTAITENEDVPNPAIEDTSAEAALPLGENECVFLAALLYGGDIKAASAGAMPSLLADSINEKLFDTFGDTVIEFDGDTPHIIEDYEDELKGKIPR